MLALLQRADNHLSAVMQCLVQDGGRGLRAKVGWVRKDDPTFAEVAIGDVTYGEVSDGKIIPYIHKGDSCDITHEVLNVKRNNDDQAMCYIRPDTYFVGVQARSLGGFESLATHNSNRDVFDPSTKQELWKCGEYSINLLIPVKIYSDVFLTRRRNPIPVDARIARIHGHFSEVSALLSADVLAFWGKVNLTDSRNGNFIDVCHFLLDFIVVVVKDPLMSICNNKFHFLKVSGQKVVTNGRFMSECDKFWNEIEEMDPDDMETRIYQCIFFAEHVVLWLNSAYGEGRSGFESDKNIRILFASILRAIESLKKLQKSGKTLECNGGIFSALKIFADELTILYGEDGKFFSVFSYQGPAITKRLIDHLRTPFAG